MLRWSIFALLLSISYQWKNSSANGFLFSPKYQIFLNYLRQSQPHQYTVSWDFGNNYNSINQGFSYATNQYGKFDI